MGWFPRARAGLLAITVLSVGIAPGIAGAQELSGVALGPEGEPLTDVPVVLHRVGGGGGAFVATDTTTPEGRFRFALDQGDVAIYFVALRYDNRMYIGPAVEGGGDPVTDYVLRVEPGSEAGAVASALSGQGATRPSTPPPGRTGPKSSDTGAFILVGLLALAAVAAFIIAAPRYRQRRMRQSVIELATVENALADPSVEDRERLLATRDRLRKQLAPGG